MAFVESGRLCEGSENTYCWVCQDASATLEAKVRHVRHLITQKRKWHVIYEATQSCGSGSTASLGCTPLLSIPATERRHEFLTNRHLVRYVDLSKQCHVTLRYLLVLLLPVSSH